NTGLYICPETRQCRLEPVWTHQQIRQHEKSAFVRDGRSHDSRIRLDRADLHRREHGSALVLDRSTDLRCCLCTRIDAENRNQQCRGNAHNDVFHLSPILAVVLPPEFWEHSSHKEAQNTQDLSVARG